MQKSRMFEGLRTWNPWFGCRYRCYRGRCWAAVRIAPRVGAAINCQECQGFYPHFHAERLNRIPRDRKIFVVAHGDLFGSWVPKHIIITILDKCRWIDKNSPSTAKELWFFESKNPIRFAEFIDFFPENTMLSTTIETNRHYNSEIMGAAPSPIRRHIAMHSLKKKFPIHISIEPILDFDLIDLIKWMEVLNPEKVAVGYDSLDNNLPEPPKEKTMKLIRALEKFTDVERKQL